MELSINTLRDFLNQELGKGLDVPQGQWHSKRLLDCMRYALASPGKRLRPLMTLSASLSTDAQASLPMVRAALPAALAIEFVHTYSLIHDDLPAMDNDDYRRGRLCAHRQYDEALAILAGDALLADAFLMALKSKNNPHKIAQELAQASGSLALVAGQAEDLNPHLCHEKKDWLSINQAKTARLFEAAAVMGGLSQQASPQKLEALRSFGQAFGQAFQIQDDCMDRQGLFQKENNQRLLELKYLALKKASESLKNLPNPRLLEDLLHLTFASPL